jgi:hypothetical protein
MPITPMQSKFTGKFDHSNRNWHPNGTYNRTFLQCQQAYANDILQARGHLFLNEVHDMLGLPRTSDGQLVGWVKNALDYYVDFGLFEQFGTDATEFDLTFNVDGVIYDKI